MPTEIERSFRELKDLVETRSIYHRRAQRECGHTFSWQLWPSCWLVHWRKNSRPRGCRCPALSDWKPCACTSLTSEPGQRSDAESLAAIIKHARFELPLKSVTLKSLEKMPA
jgi:hypothetical protein